MRTLRASLSFGCPFDPWVMLMFRPASRQRLQCFEGPNEPFSEYCTKVPALKGVPEFTDAKTWYPGFETRGDGSLFYRDFDASMVVPSKGDQPYSTRVVNADGSPATELYGLPNLPIEDGLVALAVHRAPMTSR